MIITEMVRDEKELFNLIGTFIYREWNLYIGVKNRTGKGNKQTISMLFGVTLLFHLCLQILE